MTAPPTTDLLIPVLHRCFSPHRLRGYLTHCDDDAEAAVALYQWNTEISGAMWESIGHVEVALRNSIARQLDDRHRRLARRGSWLDDPMRELEHRRRIDIAKARERTLQNRKPPSDAQIISELPFGFWRFLLTKRYATTLWPELAKGFPHSPNRSRKIVEQPVQRLHTFRNRIAHHQRIWTEPLNARWADLSALASYVDPVLRDWIMAHSRVPTVLARCPANRPHP